MANETIKILEQQREDLVVRVLKKHEEAEAHRAFTERILSGIAELLLVLDEQFVPIQANREFYSKTGFPLISESPLALGDLFDEESINRIKESLVSTEFEEFEAQLQKKHGTLPVKLRGSAHVNPSGITLYMLICSDCSEFYELMERLREGQKQLIHSSRLANLGEMTAGIGHELTQPLNAILLFARNNIKALNQAQPDMELIRHNMESIIDRVNKASSIINTMRSFGRKAEDNLYPIAINPLINKILQFLDAQLRIGEVEVVDDLCAFGCIVLAIEVQLEQVLLNLIHNAIQAMGMVQSPLLAISTTVVNKVNPQTMRRKPYVQIDIQDNGHGMDSETRKKIFDPFFTTREAGTGMGLGLSIVERLVRNFSGCIEVDSTPDCGTCFSIFLPQHQESSSTRK